MFLYGPREQSLGQKFAQWFNFTFVDYSPEVRQKAIKAGWEATCCTLFKMPAQCGGLPGPHPGQQPADLVYSPETQDIRYRKERGSGEPTTVRQAFSQQEELYYFNLGEMPCNSGGHGGLDPPHDVPRRPMSLSHVPGATEGTPSRGPG